MHYVRFLKPPKVQGNGAGRRLTALCTISTDLGDDFLPADADLEVALSANDIKSGLVASQKIRWKSGMRVLPLEMRVSQRTAGLCFLDVSPLDSLLARATYSGGSDAQLRMPLVVPARSVMVVIPQEESLADRMNVRRLDLGRHGTLKVWEESGESIARHIWDAGLSLAIFLSKEDLVAQSMPTLAALISGQNDSRLSVVELGAGTGVVSLALSRILSNASVLVTDLADVEDLTLRNIAANLASARASINFGTLDWDNDLPEATVGPHDLVVAADVIYNPDSSPALVKTIGTIAARSPNLKVLVAMKKRHQSEDVFFDLMTDASFVIDEQTVVLLPGAIAPDDTKMAEKVHIYLFSSQ